MPVGEAQALLAGRGTPTYGFRWHEDYPAPETLDALALTVAAHRAAGWPGTTTPSWWLHQIVAVEVGYHVVAGVRGRGVATQACRLLLQCAWAAGAAVVRAETEAGNAASRRVLARAGFRSDGQGWFRLDRPGGP